MSHHRPNPLAPDPPGAGLSVAEAEALAAAIARSEEASPAAWAALSGCRLIEISTAGAAPGTPGAGAGAGAIIQGYVRPGRPPPRPDPAALLRLGVALPIYTPDPWGGAALAGVALGLAVLQGLVARGWSSAQVTLWTDRPADAAPAGGAPPAALGSHVARQQQALRWAVPGGVRIAWREATRGASAAAQALALEAAFAGDPAALARYRSLRERRPSAPAPLLHQPPLDTDYVLILGDHPPVGMLATTPAYRLWARDGRSRQGYAAIRPSRATADGEAAAWASLVAALEDVLARITRRRREPDRFSLTVYSSCEPLVAALRAGGPGAPGSRAQAAALLARFGATAVIWQPPALLAAWLAGADHD